MGCRGGGGGRRPGATAGGAVTATTCESWCVSRVSAQWVVRGEGYAFEGDLKVLR
jgi:hypothetical protein